MTKYVENDNIDIFSIATNGLISTEEKTFILDPLGYFVLKVKEEIVIHEPYTAGGGYSRTNGKLGAAPTKKKKRVSLEVTFPKELNSKKFHEEFYLDNFHLTITKAQFIDNGNKIRLTISTPDLRENYEKLVDVNVSNIF